MLGPSGFAINLDRARARADVMTERLDDDRTAWNPVGRRAEARREPR